MLLSLPTSLHLGLLHLMDAEGQFDGAVRRGQAKFISQINAVLIEPGAHMSKKGYCSSTGIEISGQGQGEGHYQGEADGNESLLLPSHFLLAPPLAKPCRSLGGT